MGVNHNKHLFGKETEATSMHLVRMSVTRALRLPNISWQACEVLMLQPQFSLFPLMYPVLERGRCFSPQTFPDGLIKTQLWLVIVQLNSDSATEGHPLRIWGGGHERPILVSFVFARPDLICIWTLTMVGKFSGKGQRFSVDVNNVILDLKQFRNCVCADNGQLYFSCSYSLGSMARDYLSQLWWAC